MTEELYTLGDLDAGADRDEIDAAASELAGLYVPHTNGVSAALIDDDLPLTDASSEPPRRLRFYTGAEFRKQQLARISPLLGSGNDALILLREP